MKKIQVLSSDCYLGKLADVDDGRSSYTHIAKIRYDDKQLRCHVKLFSDYKQLNNEITAYILARLDGQPIPEHACIIKIKQNDILNAFPAAQVTGDAYGWATNTIVGKTPNSYFKEGTKEYELALKALAKINGIASLIAFDNLIANPDRNTGNVILSGDLTSFWIFDHDQSPFKPDWTLQDLDPNSDTRCVITAALFPKGLPSTIKSLVVDAAKSHSANLVNMLDYTLSWWQHLLTPDEVKALGDFYKNRAQYSESRLLKKMGMLC